MKQAAVGFRAIQAGPLWSRYRLKSLPRALLRQRPHLVKTFTYEFRQPYHTAGRRPAEASSIIAHVRTDARQLAYQAIQSVQTSLHQQNYELKHCSLLLASGRPLPDLPQILSSHALIHTADGELFREALIHASQRWRLRDLHNKRE